MAGAPPRASASVLISPLLPLLEEDPQLVRARQARALLATRADPERVDPRFASGLAGLEQVAEGIARLTTSGLSVHVTALSTALEGLLGSVEEALAPLHDLPERRIRRRARLTDGPGARAARTSPAADTAENGAPA